MAEENIQTPSSTTERRDDPSMRTEEDVYAASREVTRRFFRIEGSLEEHQARAKLERDARTSPAAARKLAKIAPRAPGPRAIRAITPTVTAPRTDPQTSDWLGEQILRIVRDLARGNGVGDDDIDLVACAAGRHSVSARLTATGFWQTHFTGERPGRTHPGGAFVRSRDDARDTAQAFYQHARGGAGFAKAVRDLVEPAPLDALAAGKREVTLLQNIGSLYSHDKHLACGGEGSTTCTYCHDGKQACGCYGGYVHEPVYNPGPGGKRFVQRICNQCRGSGRHGTCLSCKGTRRVPCHGCAETGVMTSTQRVSAGVKLTFDHLAADSQAPDVVKSRVRYADPADVRRRARIAFAGTQGGDGVWHFDYTGDIAHGIARLKIGDLPACDFEAVGEDVAFENPPAFLDHLIADTLKAIDGARDHAARLKAAGATRLTSEILARCAKRGKQKPEALAQAWRECISPKMVGYLVTQMNRAYDGVGAHAVRSGLLLALPAVPLVAVAALLTDWTERLARGPLEMGGGDYGSFILTTALCLGAATWAFVRGFAAHRGRKAVARVLGTTAQRSPKQPGGLAVAAPLLSLLFAGALGAGLYAGPGALETATRLTPTAKLDYLVDRLQGLRATGALSRKGPADAELQGDPDVYRMQWYLKALGAYQDALDGLDGPATRAAVSRFHARFPRHPETADPAAIVRQAYAALYR